MHPHCTAAAAYSVYTQADSGQHIEDRIRDTHLARRVSPRVYTWYSKRRPFRPRKHNVLNTSKKKTARRLKCRIYIGGYWRYQRRPGPANKIKQGHLKSTPTVKQNKISNSHQTNTVLYTTLFYFCFVFGGQSAFVVILDVWLLRTCNARPVHSGRLFLHAHLSHLFFSLFIIAARHF